MMWRKVLEKVDKDSAEDLTWILIRKGWNAGNQMSYPVVEVTVRTEIAEEATLLRRVLESHITCPPQFN